jgi:hypothetical protein
LRKAAPGALLWLRRGLIAACLLSLFAWATRWAAENPGGMPQDLFLGFAALPPLVGNTIGDLTSDRFRLSRVPDGFGGKAGYRPLVNRTRHAIGGVVMRRTGATEPGWRVIHGIFHIGGKPHYAAIAISPAFAIEHVWLIDDAALTESGTHFGQAPFPHGFALLADGSIVVGFDDVYRTVRIDACGTPRWTSDAAINHALYATDDGRFAWGVGTPDELQRIDLATGKIVQRITVDELSAANPDISALVARRIDDNRLGENPKDDTDRPGRDPWHINDVEPLPAALASSFPMFAAGDLLVSFRSLNLVLIVDPRTLRIKWLNNDTLLRQHDPDWNANGEISVLDNQMGRRFSRIVGFSPATGTHRVIADGAALDFYTRIRGKHQLLPARGLLITSAQQGRIIETGRDGKVAAEILVQDPDRPGSNFAVSEALFFPSTTLAFRKDFSCAD